MLVICRLVKMLIVIFCVSFFFFCSGNVQAKYLTYAEYFIDTDPGEGNGDAIIPCDGNFDENKEEFCVTNITSSNLTEGRHVLFLRLKDSENNWGMRKITFYITLSNSYVNKFITGAEYFIDNDPGRGNGLPVSATDGNFDNSTEHLLNKNVDLSHLSIGKHFLYVRIKDSYAVWGTPRKFDFKINAFNPYKKIVAAEYFINTDPGQGNGIPLFPNDDVFDESSEQVSLDSISAKMLNIGTDTIYVRFRDNYSNWDNFNGWGPVFSSLLEVKEKTDVLEDTILSILPTEFALYQNHPNPFNPTTDINFSLPTAEHVKLEIYNIMGQKVSTLVNENKEAGVYMVGWDASNVASGIYFYRITVGNFIQTKKMLLLK